MTVRGGTQLWQGQAWRFYVRLNSATRLLNTAEALDYVRTRGS